jgi:4-diphosphocytidyl-2-C-methyl-D-erythritol kinase
MVRLRRLPFPPARAKKLVLKSYAKLNLYLAVLNKRRDNYHNIKTVFEKIGLYDTVILKSRPDKKIKIISNNPAAPADSSNLAYRAARLLQTDLGIAQGLEIKIIPVGAGLGGGSSNAASVLLGLNKLWGLNLSRNRLAAFAKRIGSDTPFFIYNSSFAQGRGRGERIAPLAELNKVKLWHILVVSKIKVSTPFIYKMWDRDSVDAPGAQISKRARLTISRYNAKILASGLKKNNLSLIARVLFNSLEPVTTSLYPQLMRIKERLKSLGVKAILMSGSGPAIFGIVSSRKEAVSLCRQLKKENSSWRMYVTGTV